MKNGKNQTQKPGFDRPFKPGFVSGLKKVQVTRVFVFGQTGLQTVIGQMMVAVILHLKYSKLT